MRYIHRLGSGFFLLWIVFSWLIFIGWIFYLTQVQISKLSPPLLITSCHQKHKLKCLLIDPNLNLNLKRLNNGTTTMAANVSSNSFLLTTTYRSKLRNSKNTRQFTVFAKNAEPSSDKEVRTNPFKFDWAKMSDMKSLIPVVSTPPALGGPNRQKDSGTVFVAGATGLAGARIAQELLREGFKVRAGVPDLGAAQELARFALDYKIISAEELKRLNAVESVFEDAESIAKAMGNASKVVVTIGTSENGPAKKVTTSDALQVVEAAQLAGVRHMAIIYDNSTTTASASSVLEGISSFFNNFFSKSQPVSVSEFLDKLVQTDVKFTFIKTALTEDFSPESSYKVVVAAEGRAVENEFKVM